MKVKVNKKDFIECCKLLRCNGVTTLLVSTKADQIDNVFIDTIKDEGMSKDMMCIYGGKSPIFGKCYVYCDVIEEDKEVCVSNLYNIIEDVKSLKSDVKNAIIHITNKDVRIYNEGDEDNSSSNGRRLLPMSADLRFWYNHNFDFEDTIRFKVDDGNKQKQYDYIPWFSTDDTKSLKEFSKRGFKGIFTDVMIISTDDKIKLMLSNNRFNKEDKRVINGEIYNKHSMKMRYYDPIFTNIKEYAQFFYYYNDNTKKTKVWIKSGDNEWMVLID